MRLIFCSSGKYVFSMQTNFHLMKHILIIFNETYVVISIYMYWYIYKQSDLQINLKTATMWHIGGILDLGSRVVLPKAYLRDKDGNAPQYCYSSFNSGMQMHIASMVNPYLHTDLTNVYIYICIYIILIMTPYMAYFPFLNTIRLATRWKPYNRNHLAFDVSRFWPLMLLECQYTWFPLQYAAWKVDPQHDIAKKKERMQSIRIQFQQKWRSIKDLEELSSFEPYILCGRGSDKYITTALI